MTGHIVVINNPLARGGKNNPLHMPWQHDCQNITVHHTSDPDEATILALNAARQGARAVVAAGGDGTIHAVLRGLGANNTVPLGIMPVGTMNVFARELGLPTDPRKCWDIIRTGHTRAVDAGRANDRLFLSNAGVGLDAQVVAETDPTIRRHLGPVSYVLKGFEIASRPAPELTLTADDGPPLTATFVMLGNGRYYGGPFVLFPEGNLNDGLLDALVFQKMSFWDVLRYLHGLATGRAEDLGDVHRLRVHQLQVYCAAGSIPFECDGELGGHTPVTFRALPNAVNVIAPPP